ncbi:MAG: acetoacetate decarboxylase family protein [Myxococcota bacterium]
MAESETRADPNRYVIQGKRVEFPVVVRHASAGSATYAVSASAARELLPGPEFSIAPVWPGKALLSLAIIDYRDNDLGDYNEVSVALFVRPTDQPAGVPYLHNMLDMVRGQLGTYIVHLPVNQEFTREAGSAIWGFPKTVQEIEFRYGDSRASCSLVYDGEHALTLSVPRGGSKTLPETVLTGYTYIEGVAHANTFTSRAEGFGIRRGGVELTLGSGVIPDQLRRLGLPKRPLMCTWMEKMSASFGPSEKL